MATLNSERFCDQAPAQVWATLLDEGTYLCSIATMYRLLPARHQTREMCHIDHEDRTDLIGNLAEPREIENA